MKIKNLERIEKDGGLKPHWSFNNGDFIIWKTGCWIEPYEVYMGKKEDGKYAKDDFMFCSSRVSLAVEKIKKYLNNEQVS